NEALPVVDAMDFAAFASFPAPPDDEEAAPGATTAARSPAETAPTGRAAGAGAAETLRVPLGRVDALIGLVGELVVQRSGLVERLERRGAGIEALEPSLQRLRRLAIDLEDRFGYSGNLRAWGPLTRRGSFTTSTASEFDELEFDRYGEAYQLARELTELAA